VITSNKTTNYNSYIRSFIRYKKGVCISGTPSIWIFIYRYQTKLRMINTYINFYILLKSMIKL